MSTDRSLLSPVVARADRWLRERPAAASVWPVHWTQLLGHLALTAFVVLAVTGVLLAFPYEPGIEPVTYRGAAELYDGRELPRAFASTVRISQDLPGGALLRRLHASAGHLVVGATVLHLLRVLLVGAFQGRRAVNHLVGVGLLGLLLVTGWTGENLPFDLVAGTSLRIGYSVLGSIPYVGEPLAVLVYGGEYPTGAILERSFWLHTLLAPGAFAAGAALHLWLVRRHTPTAVPGEGDVDTIAGVRLWPHFVARLTVLLVATLALLAAASAVVPWSDVELEGPYRVAQAGNTLQPPWYLFLPEGAMRILPAIDVPLPGGERITNVFVAAVLLPTLLGVLGALLPWLDRRLGGAWTAQHVAAHPLDVPGRTVLVAVLGAVALVLTAGATVDVVARALEVPVQAVIVTLRVALVVAPVGAALGVSYLARRHAGGGRRSRERERRGRESNP